MSRGLFVHPTGNPNARNAVLALDEVAGRSDVVTAVLYDKSGSLGQVVASLPEPIRLRLEAELGRRAWLDAGREGVTTAPAREIARLALVKTGLAKLLGLSPQRLTDWIYEAIDREAAKLAARNRYDLVYAYEDGALRTFEEASKRRILRLYDLPILYHRTAGAIQTEEAERFPDLRASLAAANEPQAKLERKAAELALASHIFVASTVTKQSLLDAGVESSRISVIPYGAPLEYFRPRPKPDRVFRALFVGRVGPRKGIHYLLDAWKNMPRDGATLTLVGINEFPAGWLERRSGGIDYRPSVPHHLLNDVYSSASVLVFPSLVDGFGMVILEAMSCGIPVIATPNTAAPDLIEDGKDGFLVPIRDEAALRDRLDWCRSHPQELEAMGFAARRKAEQYTWTRYRTDLGARIRNLLSGKAA